MKRAAAALLLLAVLACCREQPQTLYARGCEALQRSDTKEAERIAADGERRFAGQPYWRELFAILEAESVIRTDPARASKILQQTPATGAPLPSVRRLIARGVLAKSAQETDETYLRADALAARAVPELRPEIAWRRVLPLFALDQKEQAARCAEEAIRGAAAAKQLWVVAGAYNHLGLIESKQGRWAEAIGHYRLSMQYAKASKSRPGEIAAMSNLGWSYLETGDFEQALEMLRPVLVAARERSIPSLEHTTLIHIADVYERRLELDDALRYAKEGLSVARRLGPKELANSLHQLCQIEFELGHYDAATKLNGEALAIRAKGEYEAELYDRFMQARILAATGNPALALEILEDVLASCYGKPDAPMRWRVQGIEADIHGKLGHTAEAERMYETTLATGADARKSVQGPESSFAFERNLLGFYDGYIELLLQVKRPADALRVAERSRGRTLRDEIRFFEKKDIDPVALARANNATILYYWLGADRSLLWTVTAHGIDVATLPADDEIDRVADEYRAELQTLEHSLTSPRGAKLYEMLVAPAKIAPSSRVIILPDSHLNALSFDALIVPAPSPHYWIDDVTVSYSPSLHLLASTPAWTGVRDARALVFGDVPAAGRDFPRLARAGVEIADVKKHFAPSRLLVLAGPAATPASYAAAHPEQFQFIHFAAHATASTGAPLDSSVILAPGAKGVRLSGREIVHIPIAAELVTLSSCNSAGRRSYAGEGLVGLAWAFLGAGAHRVVAAQWEVSDSAAPAVMDLMYAAISTGIEPAEALRGAKLALLHSDTVHERPVYWAPFVVYGAM